MKGNVMKKRIGFFTLLLSLSFLYLTMVPSGSYSQEQQLDTPTIWLQGVDLKQLTQKKEALPQVDLRIHLPCPVSGSNIGTNLINAICKKAMNSRPEDAAYSPEVVRNACQLGVNFLANRSNYGFVSFSCGGPNFTSLRNLKTQIENNQIEVDEKRLCACLNNLRNRSNEEVWDAAEESLSSGEWLSFSSTMFRTQGCSGLLYPGGNCQVARVTCVCGHDGFLMDHRKSTCTPSSDIQTELHDNADTLCRSVPEREISAETTCMVNEWYCKEECNL